MYSISDESYQSHSVHAYVKTVYEFYHEAGRSPIICGTIGLKGFIDLNRVISESLAETMDTISYTLTKGRINDTYALLRKYRDSITAHIYIIIYLQNSFSESTSNRCHDFKVDFETNKFIVKKIQDWIEKKEKLPKYKDMIKYILNEPFSGEYWALMNNDYYIDLGKRCNDQLHLNFYGSFVQNIPDYIYDRTSILDRLNKDIEALFIWHLTYILVFSGYLVMASDYLDYLECDLTPPENSQYWVAPFVIDTYDKTIRKKFPKLDKLIQRYTYMYLNSQED
jgi:hypothetical protein